jgi:hypothetical protein
MVYLVNETGKRTRVYPKLATVLQFPKPLARAIRKRVKNGVPR